MKVTLAACVFVATSLVLLEAKPFHGQLLKTQSKGRAVKEVWQDCSKSIWSGEYSHQNEIVKSVKTHVVLRLS